jgi:hypothetical protein
MYHELMKSELFKRYMPSGYGGNKADEFYQRQQKDSSEEYATVL